MEDQTNQNNDSKTVYMTYVVSQREKIVEILLSYNEFKKADKKKYSGTQYDEFWRKVEITPP